MCVKGGVPGIIARKEEVIYQISAKVVFFCTVEQSNIFPTSIKIERKCIVRLFIYFSVLLIKKLIIPSVFEFFTLFFLLIAYN